MTRNEPDEQGKSDRSRADVAYAVNLIVNEEVHGKGTFEEEAANNEALGRNILKEELGQFAEADELEEFADADRIRDRMITNSRQDIAATFAHAKSAFRYSFACRAELRKIRYLLWIVIILNATLTVAVLSGVF